MASEKLTIHVEVSGVDQLRDAAVMGVRTAIGFMQEAIKKQIDDNLAGPESRQAMLRTLDEMEEKLADLTVDASSDRRFADTLDHNVPTRVNL